MAKESNKEQTDRLITKLDAQIDGYLADPQAMKEYLAFMAQFPQYSYGNAALIQAQFKGAQAVGTFKFFQKLGFPIRRGENAVIRILQPIIADIFKDAKGNWQFVKDATPQEKAAIKKGELETDKRPMGFRPLPVFDISQTTARADDLPAVFPNKWLDGSHPLTSIVEQGVRHVMDARGVGFSREAWKQSYGVVKGKYFIKERAILLNPRNSDIQNCKTLIHEVGHAILHEKTTLSAPEKEFQAELTAYSVCSVYGIDTSEYSLAYLKHWTSDLKMRDHLLRGVQQTVKEITTSINQVIEQEKEKWLGMNRDTVIQEYQRKIEGLHAGKYDVGTPLLTQYDHLHTPYDSLDLRLDAMAKMSQQTESLVPKERLEHITRQLGEQLSSQDAEAQASFLRNENRQLQLKEETPVVIQSVRKKQANQKDHSYEMER